MAQEEEGGKVNQTVSEHARRKSLPADAFDLPRWVPEQTGPYDLGDPYDNHFAFAKAQANLSGEDAVVHSHARNGVVPGPLPLDAGRGNPTSGAPSVARRLRPRCQNRQVARRP